MRINIRIGCIICLLGSSLGCSSSNNSGASTGDGAETHDNGGDSVDSSLTGIATAARTGEPVALNIQTLESALRGLQGLEPVSVEVGDTVTTLLEKAR